MLFYVKFSTLTEIKDGSWSCECENGFVERDNLCQDDNECDKGFTSSIHVAFTESLISEEICSNGYTCENTHGSYICTDDNECEKGS